IDSRKFLFILSIRSRHTRFSRDWSSDVCSSDIFVTRQIELPYTTHFLISNNEEIGYGGNSNIPPQTVEYLAVDMGAIGDGQATRSEERRVGTVVRSCMCVSRSYISSQYTQYVYC